MELWQKVLIGFVLGIIAGFVMGPEAVNFKFLGTIFINLIKMIIVPLVFFALVSGITSLAEGKDIKRLGIKVILSYLATCAFAVVIGIGCGLIFTPGVGVDLGLQNAGEAVMANKTPPSVGETLMGIIPTNAIQAMAEGHILQVVVFAIFTGVTLVMMGKSGQKVVGFCNDASKVFFTMISTIVKFAPFAVFGFISWSVGTQGTEVLISLGKLVYTVLFACGVQIAVFAVIMVLFGRMSPLPFFRKMIGVQMMAFSTSSSKATLPTTMEVLHEKMGVSKGSTNFVLPLGAAINMDGTAIYLAICALFFAQATGTVLGMHDYLMLVLTCTLGAIGAAGIPSGSIIFMGMVLHSVGLPMEAIGVILGVDRILDMVRTVVNITGDACITVVIDKTENQLDMKQYNA